MKREYVLLGALVATYLYFKDDLESYLMAKSKNWSRFDPLFNKYGLMYGVSAEFLKAIALNESLLGDERSVARGLVSPSDVEGSKSSDGLSWGLMQVTLSTAREMDSSATPEKLNNPDFSIRLAAQYIAKLQNMFDKSDPRYWEYVAKSYNQGPGNTKKREISGLQALNPNVEKYWDRLQRNLILVKTNKG